MHIKFQPDLDVTAVTVGVAGYYVVTSLNRIPIEFNWIQIFLQDPDPYQKSSDPKRVGLFYTLNWENVVAWLDM